MAAKFNKITNENIFVLWQTWLPHITTISHIQFCLDRWKQGCPASTTTARSLSVTEQCLQCAKNAFENSSQVRIFETVFCLAAQLLWRRVVSEKRWRTSGERSGVGLRYEGRVVGFTFRWRWTINHCCRFHNGWLGPLFFTNWYYRLEKWNCGTIQLLSNLCNRKPECWSGPG